MEEVILVQEDQEWLWPTNWRTRYIWTTWTPPGIGPQGMVVNQAQPQVVNVVAAPNFGT